LSQADGVLDTVREILKRVPENVRACVVDADGLNALAKSVGWQDGIAARLVLTPHPGEMARLTQTSVAEIQDDRLAVALAAAARWNQVVVLKGAHTIVAAPDGRAAISPHATALLATAGTGDVLAGTIAGFIAQGVELFEAAACGVYVHGVAAEETAEDLGDRGLIASDLLPALPRAIRTVREGKAMRGAPLFPPGLGQIGGLQGAAEQS
jgi:NAD(P)H-hydrate epimerase